MQKTKKKPHHGRTLAYLRERHAAPMERAPAMLALSRSLKSRLIEILQRRRKLPDRDPRESELLADLRRSLKASQLLDEKRIPYAIWLRIQNEVRTRWILKPLAGLLPIRICWTCLFQCPCSKPQCKDCDFPVHNS